MKKIAITSLFLGSLFFANAEQKELKLTSNATLKKATPQQQLLSSTIVNSTYKQLQIFVHDDMNALSEFSCIPYSYADLVKHRDSLMMALQELQSRISAHEANAMKDKTPSKIVNFYKAANNYLASARSLLNSGQEQESEAKNCEIKRPVKQTINRYNRALDQLIATYHNVII